MKRLLSLMTAPKNWGLAKRMALVSVGLLLLIQIAIQLVLRTSIENSVEVNLRTELESSANVWKRLVDQNAQQLQLGASILAADFGFRGAVASNDAETIESALENNATRIGATVAALMDTQFQTKGVVAAEKSPALAQALEGLARELSTSSHKSKAIVVNGRLHQFVMVPVRAPVVIGWIMMGFPVDQALAKDMVALTNTQVVLIQSSGTQSPRLIHSSWSPAEPLDLAQFSQDKGSVRIDGNDFAFRRSDVGQAAHGVQIVLLASKSDARKVFGSTKVALLVIDGIGLLLFALGSLELARRVSKPLQLLVADTVRLGRGDYSQKIEDLGRHDEIGNFARSFDQMRQNIRASQAEVHQLAYWDRMTGLPNRAQFRERLKQCLVADTGHMESVAVIVLDLDRLKHINDVLGYSFGDQILKVVADRLQQLFNDPKSLLARLGGGQYAVLLAGLDKEGAVEQTKRIQAALEAPVTIDGQTVDLRAGMGIAAWPEHPGDADVLIGHAEVAMYAAKRKSTGVQVYDAALDSGSALTLSMLSELRQAIDQNELRLFLQPKIGLLSHRVVAAEALVRWEHPTRGLIPPMEFIPFAEQTGFVRYLTLWVLEETAKQWSSLQSPQGQLRIAINLSTRDLMDQEFPEKLEALLTQYGVPREGFCLEITESAIMDDPARAEETLNRLAAFGYKLSIDDFGTGYSSLAYLKRLPVSELKIDKSFVMGMEKDVSDAQIVKSTIDLAHNLGLSVVAEGIENQQVYDLLGALHCDEGQGYFMSKPMLWSKFVAWRDQWEKRHHNA
jgi:diguanylate cyclase (GGDEF)-like protein